MDVGRDQPERLGQQRQGFRDAAGGFERIAVIAALE